MDTEDHIWKLVTKKLANEATGKELAKLDGLLKENPIAHNSLKMLFDWWDKEPEEPQADKSALLFKKILSQIDHKK